MCSEAAGGLLRGGGWLRFGFGFGVLAAEALDAARGVDQLLLAGEKRVAVGADFGVDVAFVGGAGGEVVAAGADDANLVVIGVNFLFGHVAVLGPFRRFFLFYRICGVFTVLRFARRDAGSKRIGRGGRGCILRGLDEALGSRGFGKVTGHRIVSFLLGCWLVGWAGSAARAQRYTTQEVGVGAASETASAYFYALPLYSYTGPRNDFVGPVGRYTWNLSPSLAIEGSVAYLPGYQSGGATDTGHELLALGGVKAGWRGRRFGIYGKAEPGISSWTPGLVVYEGTPQSYRVVDERRTDFTMDMGGVVEIYPTPRTIVRFDGGQTLIAEYDQVTFREGNRQTFELEEIAQGHIAQHFSAAVTVARRFGGLREEREREPARRPLEMGALFSLDQRVHTSDDQILPNRGGGAWMSWNFSKYVALDTTAFYSPQDDKVDFPQDGGRDLMAVWGIKAGIRRDRLGYFATVRPGMMQFSRTNYYQNVYTRPVVFLSGKTTDFVSDVGGVVEYYAGKHFLLRADVGNGYVHYHGADLRYTISSKATLTPKDAYYPPFQRASIVTLFGVGWRF